MRSSVGRRETAGRFGMKPETAIESRIAQDEYGLKASLSGSCQCFEHERTADTGPLAIRPDRNRREPKRLEWCLHP